MTGRPVDMEVPHRTSRAPFVSLCFVYFSRSGSKGAMRRHDRVYLHGPHPRKTMVWNHGLHRLRTMVLKSPSATTSMFFSIDRCQGRDFQDHGSEGAQTMVQDHGFARVGTMQVQAIMPPSKTLKAKSGNLNPFCVFCPFFPVKYREIREKRARCAEKGLDYQILPLKGLLDFQGRHGITSVVRWNLRPFGPESELQSTFSLFSGPNRVESWARNQVGEGFRGGSGPEGQVRLGWPSRL